MLGELRSRYILGRLGTQGGELNAMVSEILKNGYSVLDDYVCLWN